MTLFLFFFQPFGAEVTPGTEMRYLLVCAKFGLITAFVTLTVNGLTRFFSKIFDEEKWTVWKEITFNLLFVSCIGFANLLLAHVLWDIPINGHTFWRWQITTFAVGVFPTVLGAMAGQMKLSKKYMAEAAKIAPKQHAAHDTNENWITLEGENQNEQLRLQPGQIVYVKVADNYVRVFYQANGLIKNRMLRATMKKMEDTVADYPFLFRCHRAYLVNMDLVQSVSGNAQGYRLHLDDIDETIPVSRNLNDMVQKML